MAGSYNTVALEFDREDADAMLEQLLAFGRDRAPALLRDMGDMLLNSTRDRARQQVDPDGVPWVKLSEDYDAYKKKKRPNKRILQFDSHLLGDMLSYQLDGDSALDLGTNAIYGAAHQFGYEERNLPARPFLGVSKLDTDRLIEILGDHLQAAIDGSNVTGDSAAL